MNRRILTAILTFAFSLTLLSSCSKAEDKTISDYLGDYSYNEPAICMVYEQVEGETDDNGNPCYGIQYRKVTDYEGLISCGDVFLIYFYSSMDNRSAEVTAAMEDLAQTYNGKIHILMLDAMQYSDLMKKYDIDAVPEFVLVKPGQQDTVFGSTEYDQWTINDVISWLQSYGIS